MSVNRRKCTFWDSRSALDSRCPADVSFVLGGGGLDPRKAIRCGGGCPLLFFSRCLHILLSFGAFLILFVVHRVVCVGSICFPLQEAGTGEPHDGFMPRTLSLLRLQFYYDCDGPPISLQSSSAWSHHGVEDRKGLPTSMSPRILSYSSASSYGVDLASQAPRWTLVGISWNRSLAFIRPSERERSGKFFELFGIGRGFILSSPGATWSACGGANFCQIRRILVVGECKRRRWSWNVWVV